MSGYLVWDVLGWAGLAVIKMMTICVHSYDNLFLGSRTRNAKEQVLSIRDVSQEHSLRKQLTSPVVIAISFSFCLV